MVYFLLQRICWHVWSSTLNTLTQKGALLGLSGNPMAMLGKWPIDQPWPCLLGTVPTEPGTGEKSEGLCNKPGSPDSRMLCTENEKGRRQRVFRKAQGLLNGHMGWKVQLFILQLMTKDSLSEMCPSGPQCFGTTIFQADGICIFIHCRLKYKKTPDI